jgi:ATP synthase protein I
MDEPEPGKEKKPARLWRLAMLLSYLGSVLVMPIVGGALLGSYLDKVSGHGLAWTVGLLSVGVIVSLYNLYRILFKDGQE